VRASSYEKIGNELLSELTKSNSDIFTYDSGLDGRWTYQSIEAKLNEIQSKVSGRIPANIWVCGPPEMNQTFDQVFKKMLKLGKIDNTTQVRIL